MKKIVFLLMISLLFSCQKKQEEIVRDPYEGYIETDYIADIGFAKDFIIKNEEVYFYHTSHPFKEPNYYYFTINKLDKKGDITILHQPNSEYHGNEMCLALSKDEDSFYLCTGSPIYGRRIYKFSFDDFTETKYSIPYSRRIPRITRISLYDDNSYILFDSENTQMLRFFEDTQTTEIIAGAGRSYTLSDGIIDGVGLNATLGGTERMLVVDGIIYVIDYGNNLRRLEQISNNVFRVETLISNFNVPLLDLAVDSDKNILVLGDIVYKLNTKEKKLEKFYKETRLNFVDRKRELTYSGNIGNSFSRLLIKGGDMYLYSHHIFIKISDYKTKLRSVEI